MAAFICRVHLELRGELMEPIAVIARRNLRTTPEFKSLQMPKTGGALPGLHRQRQGNGASRDDSQDTLVAHGLPSTFLDDLKAGVDKLETSMSEREKIRRQRVGATKGLTVEEKNGQTVLSVLDALMQKALPGQ